MGTSSRTDRYIIKRFILLSLAVLLVVVVTPSFLHQSAQTVAQTTNTKTAKATNVVTDWNETAIKVTQAAAVSATSQFRALAITHAAIFDAVNASDRRYTPYAVDIKAPSGTSIEAAAASAGYSVLTSLYPAQQTTLDAALTASLAKIPESQGKTDGINLGKQVATKIIALRSQDGWDAKVDYKPGTGPGVWQPTPPTFAAALTPQIAKATPFTFKNIDQFQVPPPLALNSAPYAKEINEVKSIGGKNSKVRTADQTAAAIFWTVPTPLIWNAAARAAAIKKGIDILDSARLFALLNLAGTDGYIAGYGIKYKYNFWRPVTAIRNADVAGNPAISADPNWEPLLITPAHPDYISGHCVSSGAPERILQKFFGSDKVNLSFTFPLNTGVTRSYTSFSQIGKEVGEARIWGGIHTRTADIQGEKLGYQVADYAFQNFLRPIKK
ncbi:phosphatase PAP2 family protein [Nostoc sp. CENA67]|uniref:Phosphatase PAP2 family protein n=1 Tax=Amazonocrinis nigriterrae CENA67 TaxID=2794033 RepID=A0A8J7LCE1_9NOST|nr:vanadium-dependent haloperoxidase [Amazonocrinis nigriterrae]MBH8564606.1 phosphatase PAP2 family protein [Amazonocrinis nigriterrae CENA67]